MTVNNEDYPLTTISYGRSNFFYHSITFAGASYVDTPYNGGDDGYKCHIVIPMKGPYVQTTFTVTDGSDLYLSFNGTHDHIHLVGDTGVRKDYVFPHLSQIKIWVRGSGTLEVSCYRV